ncbi:MAG: hypothetical protein PHZ07_00905 [Patescibacteria group bacterium]|nr:hypothetical protein [Patescibacteria group bacterium]MDD4304628.1 hypothetical protein [Patescibacteria group bacterium]MDD4695555.1 hypothetical protein [Patescibacteria group bacterium]
MFQGMVMGIIFGIITVLVALVFGIFIPSPYNQYVAVFVTTLFMSGQVEKFFWKVFLSIGMGFVFWLVLLADPKPAMTPAVTFFSHAGVALVGLIIFHEFRKEKD